MGGSRREVGRSRPKKIIVRPKQTMVTGGGYSPRNGSREQGCLVITKQFG